MRLEDLIIEGNSVGESVSEDDISESIEPYIRYLDGEQRRQVRTTDAFSTLSAREKVVVAVVSTEAEFQIGFRKERSREAVSLMQEFDISLDSGYPALRELEKEGLVERKDMGYMADFERFGDLLSILQTV